MSKLPLFDREDRQIHKGDTHMSKTFSEAYEVSLDYQKEDGYWVKSHKVIVLVEIQHGINEKNNHEKAEEIAKQMFTKCRINSVIYQ